MMDKIKLMLTFCSVFLESSLSSGMECSLESLLSPNVVLEEFCLGGLSVLPVSYPETMAMAYIDLGVKGGRGGGGHIGFRDPFGNLIQPRNSPGSFFRKWKYFGTKFQH